MGATKGFVCQRALMLLHPVHQKLSFAHGDWKESLPVPLNDWINLDNINR